MGSKLFRLVLLSIAIVVPASLGAQNSSSNLITALPQTSPDDPPFRGFNAYETFSGLITRSGTLLKLDSSVGYDFNRNFGVFAGMPVYFTKSFDTSSSSGSFRASGIGDAYIGAELYTFSKLLRYSSTVTVGIPTGSVARGFSPGVVTADWTNHFRRSFGRLTPNFSVGVGNTVGAGIGPITTSELVNGSLTATGAFVHMDEGAEFDLTRRVYVGGAGYHILPLGNQKSAIDGQSGDTSAATSILRENGFDTWVGFQPSSVLNTEIGYSRSTTFAQNSLSFRIGLNVGRMLRRKTT